MTLSHVSDPIALASAVGGRLDGSPLCLMLDIDGTIAPIAQRPQEATVPAQTRDILHSLVARPGVHVVLVSGRSASDAAGIASVQGAWVVGNHGMEVRAPDGRVTADETVRPFEDAVARAASVLTPVAEATDGAILENKRWTLSLHYRLVEAGAVPALEAVAHEVAQAAGLRVTEGKKVIELRPPVDINKGTAAIAMAIRLHALDDGASLLFAGDDRTDEDAFRELRSRKPGTVTIRVGGGHESAIDTHAEFALASPDELRVILGWLAERRAAETV